MKARDTKKYRHKGLRKNTIKTVMGEVEYVRAMYEVEEAGIKKRVYLLDEKLHINTEGKASENSVLTARVIDRPMRPLFPKDYRNDVSLQY